MLSELLCGTLGWRRQPPDMKDSCGYTEKSIADSGQGVVFQPWNWVGD